MPSPPNLSKDHLLLIRDELPGGKRIFPWLLGLLTLTAFLALAAVTLYSADLIWRIMQPLVSELFRGIRSAWAAPSVRFFFVTFVSCAVAFFVAREVTDALFRLGRQINRIADARRETTFNAPERIAALEARVAELERRALPTSNLDRLVKMITAGESKNPYRSQDR
jgi:hypothetical protein